ncbi:hypothetical protein NDU88_010692 [Pleurodeles waltl]|uniref:Uncharacterized protein n=1 Tax=Pleurodeles waltl TaxID=8319 RepID=A0AAV7Q0X4_PLEWA|nr:hypothetical protein NDU88_010692 [Pleurodeles waltl]
MTSPRALCDPTARTGHVGINDRAQGRPGPTDALKNRSKHKTHGSQYPAYIVIRISTLATPTPRYTKESVCVSEVVSMSRDGGKASPSLASLGVRAATRLF